jgi:hypothetical protein
LNFKIDVGFEKQMEASPLRYLKQVHHPALLQAEAAWNDQP